METQKIELKMIKMSEVQSQEVEWLWYPFIPYGKLTIIQGDPGDGKTTLVLNIAAKLSKGEGLDNDMKLSVPVNFLHICIWMKQPRIFTLILFRTLRGVNVV